MVDRAPGAPPAAGPVCPSWRSSPIGALEHRCEAVTTQGGFLFVLGCVSKSFTIREQRREV